MFSLVLEGVVVFSSIHVLTEASQEQIFLDIFFDYVIKINKICIKFI